MSFHRFRRTQVIGPLLVLASSLLAYSLSNCAAQDRTGPSWMAMQLTPDSLGVIDPLVLVVQASAEQRSAVQQKLIAAGFDVRAGAVLEVHRTGEDQAGFARDLTRLSDLFPGAVHLVVRRDGQRCEVGDALVFTPRNPDQLPALLARHHLQSPQVIIAPMVRAVTQPRDDLLHLNQRIAALRADPDVLQAEFDLITHATLK